MQRGRENNECSFYLFIQLFISFLVLLLLLGGFRVPATSDNHPYMRDLIRSHLHSFPKKKKELCVVDGVFFTSTFRLHREGIEYYST